MKTLTTPLLATLLALSALVRLTAAAPESSFGLAPSAGPQLPPSTPSNLPLIPDAPPPDKTAKEGDQAQSDRTALAEDRLKKKIALRQAKTKAERDPVLQAIWLKALAAPTDYEQRKIFIEYYTGLIDRMVKFNPEMTKEEIDLLRAQYVNRFYQAHIAPTIDPSVAHARHN